MEEGEFRDLFAKYSQNRCSQEEIKLLFNLIEQNAFTDQLGPLIDEFGRIDSPAEQNRSFKRGMYMSLEKTDSALSPIWEPKTSLSIIKTPIYQAVAAVILIFLVFYALFNYKQKSVHIKGDPQIANPLKSNSIKDKNGDVTHIPNHFVQPIIIKESNGYIVAQTSMDCVQVFNLYDLGNLFSNDSLTFLSSKGKQLTVVLTDLSKVQINSNSRISFRSGFNTDKRELSLIGEGYFQIQSIPEKPFFVNSKNQRIKVYGTEFNIKNYSSDEKAITTLFEGKISIRSMLNGRVGNEYFMKPGEQILLTNYSKPQKTQSLDEEETLAWRNGYFIYNNTSLRDILKDFSEWYDVQVDWENVPNLRYQGSIPRKYSVKEAIGILNLSSGIKINLNNNQINFK